MLTQQPIRVILLGLAFIGITGCAHMSKDECATANWHNIGYQDGTRGYAESAFNKHSQVCAKHGIGANLAKYQQGHAKGLKVYCTERVGFNEGSSGRKYTGVCSGDAEQAFLRAHAYGFDIYTAKQNLSRARNDHRDIINRIDDINAEIQHLEHRLISEKMSPVMRAQIYNDIKSLSEEKGSLETQRYQLDYHIRELENEVQRVQQASPYR